VPSRYPEQPNILFLLADDQGAWAMGCAGNRELRTPTLDRLAATGTRFENFFCTSPVCSPARASILTGRIPSQHGVHDWIRAGNAKSGRDIGGRLIRYLDGQVGYPDILKGTGYVCGMSGKWHLGDSHHPQMSFESWAVHAKGGGPYYNAPMIRDGEEYAEPRYVTDVITDNALRFLESQRDRENPFYLSVHYTAPHSPWGREHHPRDLYDAYRKHCRFESTPDLPPHPMHVKGNVPPDAGGRRDALSGYFAAVTAMDRNVGRIVDWLEKADLRADTLIVFMSDNGMNMGHHGIWGKGNGTIPLNMYDTSVKVPCIVSRPGSVPEGKTCDELLSQYDVMPTLLEYVGAPPCPEADTLPGRSFASLLRGKTAEGVGNVVVYDEYGPVRMIRSRDWKYVHRYPHGPFELYDLINDPGEETNLAARPEHACRVRDLHGQLDSWFRRYVDPDLDGSRLPVSGRGQIDLAGRNARTARSFMEGIEYHDPDAAGRALRTVL